MNRRSQLLDLPGVHESLARSRYRSDPAALDVALRCATVWKLGGNATADRALMAEVRRVYGPAGDDAVAQLKAIEQHSGNGDIRVRVLTAVAAGQDDALARDLMGLQQSYESIDVAQRIAAKRAERDGPSEPKAVDPHLTEARDDADHLRESVRAAAAFHAPSMTVDPDVRFAAQAMQRASRGEDAFADQGDLRADISAAVAASTITGLEDTIAADQEAEQAARDAGY